MLREIAEVIGTSDARHVLVLCTDGGVMYYNREADESVELVEFSKLQRNAELDQAWTVKRVGAMGDVILLRASKAFDGSAITIIDVNLLSSAASGEVKKTSLLSPPKSGDEWGYYLEGTTGESAVDIDNGEYFPSRLFSSSTKIKSNTATTSSTFRGRPPQPKKAPQTIPVFQIYCH